MKKILIFLILIFSLFMQSGVFAQGAPGANGEDGEDVIIYSDGEGDFYDVSGEDGEDGEDGSDGSDAWSMGGYLSPLPGTRNMPDGENGKDGGNGGNAGKTGNVTIYFEDLENLKNIEIRAVPGRGGYGGNGGRGGQGASCPSGVVDWLVGEEDGCTNGRNGKDGKDGADGLDGTDTIILLINSLEPLPQVNPRATVVLDKMVSSVNLSQNIIEYKEGAKELFDPRSKIPDFYYLYKETKEISVTVKLANEELLKKLGKKADEATMELFLAEDTGEVEIIDGELFDKFEVTVETKNNPSDNSIEITVKDLKNKWCLISSKKETTFTHFVLLALLICGLCFFRKA